MKNFSSFNNKSFLISASSFYSFFGILIPYLIIFILFGEVNLLNFDWNLNHKISWQLYSIIFAMTLLPPFWLVIGILTKTLKFSAFPFLISAAILSLMTFLTSLIPFTDRELLNSLIIIGRIVIIIISTLTSFFIFNKITKWIIFKSSNLNVTFDYFASKSKSDDKSNEKFKSVLDSWKKVSSKDDGPVEIEVEVVVEKEEK